MYVHPLKVAVLLPRQIRVGMNLGQTTIITTETRIRETTRRLLVPTRVTGTILATTTEIIQVGITPLVITTGIVTLAGVTLLAATTKTGALAAIIVATIAAIAVAVLRLVVTIGDLPQTEVPLEVGVTLPEARITDAEATKYYKITTCLEKSGRRSF